MLIAETSKKIQRYLDLARRMAFQSEYGKIRHGAVLVKGGSVINASCNKSNYNSFASRFRPDDRGPATHHAEIGCILGVDKSISEGATVYVVRINKQGYFKLSKPCEMCHNILKFCGVKKVVYTYDENHIDSYKL